MGTWGPGIYENDSALDWVGELTSQIEKEIRDGIEEFDESMGDDLLAAVDTLRAICENSHSSPPKPEDISKWHELYEKNWPSYIGDLGADDSFVEQQAEVIISTFQRLLGLSQKRWKR